MTSSARCSRRRNRRTEAGYAAILISIMVPTLFIGLAAVGVDIARWYLEGERLQVAADAAALAGVPFLPQDMSSAKSRALEVSKRNGYDNASSSTTVVVGPGARESQLRVTVSSTITNQFGQLFGVGRTTLTRTAVADFTGPAPMGSPCNVFGTEPPSGAGAASPTGSAIGSSRPSNCPRDPQLWATVEGPDTGKVQGDRYGTKKCEDYGVDGCDGSRNNEEYTQRGYYWLIKVMPGMVGKDISLQIFDPAFVLTGQFCTDSGMPDYTALYDNMNPYATTDGKTRYAEADTIPSSAKPAVPFCTGDSFPGGEKTNKMTTTYMVREQTDSQDPLKAPVQSSTSGEPCAKQFGAYSTSSYPSVNSLRSSSSSYDSELAKVFHNWVELCKFRPTREGDYYLHVRTNKSYSFSSGQLIRSVPTSGLSAVSGEQGDSAPKGAGSNSFGLRAVVPSGQERNVAVSGWDRMPIYVNSEAATTTFNLIRILPGAAGQFISFDFFDAGDAASTATVKVMLPTDAKTPSGGTITNPFPGGCKAVGGSAGSGQNLSNCTATLTQSNGKSRNNGKVETISIPIPSDYSCNAASFLNCWYRVEINFSNGDVHDVTTWDAQIVGDPVRLIE